MDRKVVRHLWRNLGYCWMRTEPMKRSWEWMWTDSLRRGRTWFQVAEVILAREGGSPVCIYSHSSILAVTSPPGWTVLCVLLPSGLLKAESQSFHVCVPADSALVGEDSTQTSVTKRWSPEHRLCYTNCRREELSAAMWFWLVWKSNCSIQVMRLESHVGTSPENKLWGSVSLAPPTCRGNPVWSWG